VKFESAVFLLPDHRSEHKDDQTL